MHAIRSLACLMLGVTLAACQQPASGAINELVSAMDQRHPRDAVEQRLEEAMRLYDVPMTEAGYDHAVAVLRDLRATALNQGCDECDEMQILERMIDLHPRAADLSFAQAARAAIALLLREDLYQDRSSTPLT